MLRDWYQKVSREPQVGDGHSSFAAGDVSQHYIERYANYSNPETFVPDYMTQEQIINQLKPDRRAFADQLPLDLAQDFKDTCRFAENLGNLKDPEAVYKALWSLHERSDYFIKRFNPELATEDTKQKVISFLSAGDMMGYQPAGSRMWRYFLNPMSVYTFSAEHHWAVKVALNMIRTELLHEGYKYVYGPDVTPGRLAEVDHMFKRMDMFRLAVDSCIRLLVYGNVWLLPEKNFLGKHAKITNLAADRIWPKYGSTYENLVGWEYQIGHSSIPYDLEDIAHLKDFSLKSKHIGTPRLAPGVIDIESDLAASALTATIMNKAGMIGVIIALEDPAIKNPMRMANMDRERTRLQELIQHEFSGVRAAQSALVTNYVRDVFKVTDMGKLDANFLRLRAEVGKTIALLLGVPPGRMHLPMTNSQIYQATSAEDFIQSAFDKYLSALTTEVYDFLNNEIVKRRLGIYDVEMRPRGRFSASTLTGARMAYMASQTGPLYTVNELRTIFYKLPELPPNDERGLRVVDNSTMRDPKLLESMVAEVNPMDQLALNSPGDDTTVLPEDDSSDGNVYGG